MPRLVHVTTVPESLGFVAGQVDYLRQRGYEVAVVCSPGRLLDEFARKHDVEPAAVKMNRAITPLRDADAIARLTGFLLDWGPDIVHSHTPKGGMLGMIAAQTAMVPVRIYHMRGLLISTARGLRRTLFSSAERLSCGLAHTVICQSHSLREFAIDHRIVAPRKAVVLGNGGNGVDAAGRFDPERIDGLDVRTQLGIDADDHVIGFVGRLVRDKGIGELVDAWRAIKATDPRAHLLIVGPFEERDGVEPWVERALREDDRVHLVGYVSDAPRYYEAMDVLALPSHREGFPNVPLEAAAMGVPTVTTNAVGCVDAVVDGVTGTTVDVGDARALGAALRAYLDDDELRAEHGAAARARVRADFRPDVVHRATAQLYGRLLEKHAR